MTKLAEDIIKKYYPSNSVAYEYLYRHSMSVTELAVRIAAHNPHIYVDMEKLKTASMLHDIGIFMTDAPGIGCYGDQPYIAHGYLGRKLLENEGLDDIAPVCERHVGVGISREEIIENNLPLPHRDMLPVTQEEKIICYADKFYSKKAAYLTSPKPVEKIIEKLGKYGKERQERFREMMEIFGYAYIYRSQV